VPTGRRAEVLESPATEVGECAVPVDLADLTELLRLIDEVGDVDVLIANAALPASGLLTTVTDEEIDHRPDVNSRAPMVTTRHVCQHMIAKGSGHIVFVSSLEGKVATALAPVHVATKFGIRGFSLAMRKEMRSYNAGVSAVFPGFVRAAGMFADSGVTRPDLIGNSTPEQVAQAVVRAIETKKAEIDVAPVSMRVRGRLGTVTPTLALATATMLEPLPVSKGNRENVYSDCTLRDSRPQANPLRYGSTGSPGRCVRQFCSCSPRIGRIH
jgi:short-subunit dehydrogenase